jgi:hypothetical protein
MFTLAADSRLPKWFPPPSNLKRAEITVSLCYCTDGTAIAKLIGPNDKIIQQAEGTILQTELNGSGYYVITINGVTEVVGHRPPEFYVTDDPSVIAAVNRRTKS